MKQIIFSSGLLLAVPSSYAAVAASCNDQVEALAPDSRYVLQNSDAEVLDKETGLVWQRCAAGLSGSDCATGAASALNWKAALEAASGDWRVPNIKELATLVEPKCSSPAINKTLFPNTAAAYYWSSSPVNENSNTNADRVWAVSFASGAVEQRVKNGNSRVRLVKDQ